MEFLVVGPLVDAITELWGHEEGLDEGVYVACCADVYEAFVG